MEETYYTAEEVAEILKVSVETIRTYIKAKKNPLIAYRLGRSYRIRKADFEQWMETRRLLGGEEK